MTEMTETMKAEAAHLHARGFGAVQIAKTVGCSEQQARYWGDPAYREASRRSSREAKKQHRKPRPGGCGRTILPYSTTCNACHAAARRESFVPTWSAERVVAAIQTWAAEHDGIQPTVTDFLTSDDPRFPAPTAVYRPRGPYQYCSPFESWNEAIETAGFRPLAAGHRLSDRDPWGDGTPSPVRPPTTRHYERAATATRPTLVRDEGEASEDRGGGPGNTPREETLVEMMERLGLVPA